MNLEDACKVLGLPPTELPDERTLKKAYRKASLKHHPDRNLDDPVSAAKRFQKVGAAYQRIILARDCDEVVEGLSSTSASAANAGGKNSSSCSDTAASASKRATLCWRYWMCAVS